MLYPEYSRVGRGKPSLNFRGIGQRNITPLFALLPEWRYKNKSSPDWKFNPVVYSHIEKFIWITQLIAYIKRYKYNKLKLLKKKYKI